MSVAESRWHVDPHPVVHLRVSPAIPARQPRRTVPRRYRIRDAQRRPPAVVRIMLLYQQKLFRRSLDRRDLTQAHLLILGVAERITALGRIRAGVWLAIGRLGVRRAAHQLNDRFLIVVPAQVLPNRRLADVP